MHNVARPLFRVRLRGLGYETKLQLETHFVDRTIGAKAPRVSRGWLAEQALALATEPRAKREARSVLCHTCQ